MGKFLLGADIGGILINLGRFNEEGVLICKRQIETRLENDGKFILSDIMSETEKMLNSEKSGWADVSGIGVGVPGPVLHGRFVPLAVNLGWKNRDVFEDIRKLTGVEKIKVENDAKAAALGEYWKGGWESSHSAVMITIGTAVGGAVIMDGKVLSGAFGAAGELSHIQVNPAETVPCACGKYGHLQQYVSTEGILRRFHEKNAGKNLVNEISVKDIFDLARDGEVTAMETVDETAEILGSAMAAVSCVIDPELYLIGGGVSRAGDFLLEKLRNEFRKHALPVSAEARIEAAKTGNDAGIYGAVKSVLNLS